MAQFVSEENQSEEELRQFFLLSPDILMISDLAGTIKRFNRGFYITLGYEPLELSYTNVSELVTDLVHPLDWERTHQAFRDLLEGNGSVHFENRLLCKDGSHKWFSWSALRHPQAELVYGVSHDITKEKQISETQAFLANIVHSSEDAIISFDPELRIKTWNPGAERLFGYLSVEACGKYLGECCPAVDPIEQQQLWVRVRSDQVVQGWETIRLRRDGGPVHVSLTISPLRDEEGQISGFATITRDITAQKNFEKELARLDRLNLIGQIAAGIAHEIRNPMTTIRGFLQLMGMKPQFNEEKEHLQLMIDELDRANSIISEFLSLARTKVSKPKVQSLNKILQSLYPLIKADAIREDKNVNMLLADLPELVLDEKEIRQLVLNLGKNALEAMNPGNTLHIRTCLLNDNPVLSIRDEGAGIPPEAIGKLGLPFFTTKDSGTGLGLSMCYSIATRHNAELNFETCPQGTTFYLTFNSHSNQE